MRRIWAPLILVVLALAVCCVAQEDAPAVLQPTPTPSIIKDSSLWDIFLRGGIIMWPILLTAVIGLTFAIERMIELRRAKHIPKDFHKDVVHVVDTRGVDAGLALCLEKQSSLGRVLYAALLRYGSSRQEMESAVSDEGARILYDLRKNTRIIGIMSSIAPLLGLLGTCIGLIVCFDQAAEVSTGKSEALASGVAEALITTAFGLIVGIPLLYLYFHLKGKADDVVREIDERGIDAVVTLDRKARQSIRLIDDIEEQIVTKDMPAVKPPPPDLDKEFEPSTREGSGVKSSITTHVGLPVSNSAPEKTSEKK